MYKLVESPHYFLKAEMFEGDMYLHLDYLSDKFTKSIYNLMLQDWIEILSALKEKGVTEVFSCIDSAESKTCKWQGMFGLLPYKEAEGVTVFRREL